MRDLMEDWELELIIRGHFIDDHRRADHSSESVFRGWLSQGSLSPRPAGVSPGLAEHLSVLAPKRAPQREQCWPNHRSDCQPGEDERGHSWQDSELPRAIWRASREHSFARSRGWCRWLCWRSPVVLEQHRRGCRQRCHRGQSVESKRNTILIVSLSHRSMGELTSVSWRADWRLVVRPPRRPATNANTDATRSTTVLRIGPRAVTIASSSGTAPDKALLMLFTAPSRLATAPFTTPPAEDPTFETSLSRSGNSPLRSRVIGVINPRLLVTAAISEVSVESMALMISSVALAVSPRRSWTTPRESVAELLWNSAARTTQTRRTVRNMFLGWDEPMKVRMSEWWKRRRSTGFYTQKRVV